MKVLSYGIHLFVFWLLLSGHFEPLMLGLGLVSVVLTIFLVKRMALSIKISILSIFSPHNVQLFLFTFFERSSMQILMWSKE